MEFRSIYPSRKMDKWSSAPFIHLHLCFIGLFKFSSTCPCILNSQQATKMSLQCRWINGVPLHVPIGKILISFGNLTDAWTKLKILAARLRGPVTRLRRHVRRLRRPVRRACRTYMSSTTGPPPPHLHHCHYISMTTSLPLDLHQWISISTSTLLDEIFIFTIKSRENEKFTFVHLHLAESAKIEFQLNGDGRNDA